MRSRPQTALMTRIQTLICLLIIAAVPSLGAVKLRVEEGRPIVDGVYVNGHGPYRFLLDTGANINLIETGLARKIGMNPTFQVDLATSSGKTLTPGSDGNQVALDSVQAGEQKFLFTGLEEIRKLDPGVQGVLGQWFLSRFDYVLDLRANRLEFGKQERTGTRAPFTFINARAVVATSLGNLVLDSGATRLILFGVQSRGGDTGTIKTFTGSQAIGTASRKLVLQGRDIWHGDAVTMASQTEPGVEGLLPLTLFKSIYVCNSESYLVLE